ncbi:enoyl-CoA hydratase/isomerase family protein [Conexibacter sp. SYSU D00693]|uniref:enoyl-CoA hydratase/isomerase family protein n=1 Tax=Conexibacter sp. SYSU D00693 TaxID=2812560 RepID=UPI00196A7FE3|nr:enoyl-CoA hydratase/isomerase family protein [Conexibacter sp. SYSU D00693]
MSQDDAPLTSADLGDGVREITLARPQLLNRFDRALHHALTAALLQVAGDETVRAVALTSTGKAFSAGGDFAEMRRTHQDAVARRQTIADARRMLAAVLDLPQPMVVGVQGPAIGLGATVVLLGDAVVAARRATIADTHVNVGLVAGDGGCLVWPQSAGMLRARRHLLTGDPLDAEAAFGLGLVTDLVDEPGDVRPAVLALAERIAALPPLAVQGTKRALDVVTRRRSSEVVELSLELEAQTMTTADHLEGFTAFQERRPPAFHGR